MNEKNELPSEINELLDLLVEVAQTQLSTAETQLTNKMESHDENGNLCALLDRATARNLN